MLGACAVFGGAIGESTRVQSPTPPVEPPAGGQAHLVATGSLVQQAAQVTGLLAMFAVLTVLARKLSLEELGVYGLLASIAGYLLVIQNAAASAAVRNMAAAEGPEARDAAFSTAAVIYVVAGLAVGLLIALLGIGLSAVVDLSAEVERQAQLGAVLLGAVVALGWPVTVYRDAMRARQLFVRSAMIDMVAMAVYAALVLGTAFAGASLAVLICVSGTIPLLIGIGAAIVAYARRLPFHFRPALVTRTEAGAFARFAWYVSLTEVASTLVYALDRVILGVFKSAATVGLYEGPVRAHNVLRSLNAAVLVTVLPTASKYFGVDDDRRLKELLTRGLRYTLALVVPMAVTGMVLATPLLEAWLGPKFGAAGLAMAILMSYWLVNGCTSVIQGIVIAGEGASKIVPIAWSVAAANIALSLALVPWLGLEGVAIATALPHFFAFPFLLRLARELVPVSGGELIRAAFLPAYSLAVALAAALGAAQLLLPLDSVIVVVAVALGGLLAYWLLFYAVWLEPHERQLVRQVAGGLRRARRAPAG
jgi:O-antigen/teichoic acid export membrane protein